MTRTQKLHEIVAIEKGVKSRTYGEISIIDKLAQKEEPFSGHTRVFEAKDSADEAFPPEKKKVTSNAADLLDQVARLTTEFFDVEATKDWANCEAKADIEVDGTVILAQAPVTLILFLEKQVTDLRTMIGRMVTLDESEVWLPDPSTGMFRTDPSKNHKTKKVSRPIVKYDAVIKDGVALPAQTEMITEDVIVGWWSTTKLSGALPVPRKKQIMERLDKLLQAVQSARERANDREAPKKNVGGAIFSYVLGA